MYLSQLCVVWPSCGVCCFLRRRRLLHKQEGRTNTQVPSLTKHTGLHQVPSLTNTQAYVRYHRLQNTQACISMLEVQARTGNLYNRANAPPHCLRSEWVAKPEYALPPADDLNGGAKLEYASRFFAPSPSLRMGCVEVTFQVYSKGRHSG